MQYIFAILAVLLLLVAVLAPLLRRPRDMRGALRLKTMARPMAVRAPRRDTCWAQYETPTYMRRGLSMQPGKAQSDAHKKPPKRKTKAMGSVFTANDQAELSSLLASVQGSFEVVA